MYYAEEIIDGVIHFKLTPKGKWRKKTPEALTEMVEKLRAQIRTLEETPAV
ncbi:MAG: hypothetical protein P8J32_08030 [bacterium]|nr:hypothetical protein [bacterium]